MARSSVYNQCIIQGPSHKRCNVIQDDFDRYNTNRIYVYKQFIIHGCKCKGHSKFRYTSSSECFDVSSLKDKKKDKTRKKIYILDLRTDIIKNKSSMISYHNPLFDLS